mgnify:CR=1 FL=1
MSKVTFEVEGIKITVEKEEDQGMFGRRGEYRPEDRFQYRGRFGDDFARRPYYQRGSEHDNVFPLYETRFAPVNVNQQYGKQSTGEPMFVDNVTGKPLNYEEAFERMYRPAIDAAKAKGNKANHVGPYHDRGVQLDAMGGDYDGLDDITANTKRPNQFMPAMVGVDSVEVGIAALAENNDEHFHLLGAYDKVKQAIATFIGKYIFSGEAVDLPFTQTDRGDYALLLLVPYLSMDILLYVDMVEVDGKHHATAINFDYQADIEGEDVDTPVEQSAKSYILSVLKSYIVHRRDRQYRQMAAQQPSTNPEAEGHEDRNEGNNQPTGETPTTQQKNQF